LKEILRGATPAVLPSPEPDSGERDQASLGVAGLLPRSGLPLLVLVLLGLTACHPVSTERARELVERYNSTVAEAYRRGDVKLADPVVGPNESKKLAGLIGVRLDLGLTLDSELLTLVITHVERRSGELRVRTRERWRYRERRIGSGKQVGEESLDNYEMLYVFKKAGPAWLVDEIQFTSPPEVGRKQLPWSPRHGSMPALIETSKVGEGRQP